VLTYKVVDKIVVNPDETKKIAAVPGKDLVTLITCTPLGINTQRILVTGERVVPTPAADKALRGKKPDVPRFPWWVLGCFGSLCVVGGYVWWAGLPVKKKKKEDEEDSAKDSAKDSESSSAASSEEDRELSSAKDSTVRREDLAREEAKAIKNRPKKRPKVKKSSSRKKCKRSGHGEKTFDWLISILGL
ncbi:MAG: class C sortase, partial [Gardnerella vaginalis]